MSHERRVFLQGLGALALAGTTPAGGREAAARSGASSRAREDGGIGAVAFDGFTLLDFRPLPSAAERLFPGHGARFQELFQSRLFEYGWLRVLGGQYRDFEGLSADAFRYASAALKLAPSTGEMRGYLETLVQLPPWPEAVPVLTELRAAGLKLAFLSNFTPGMLARIVRRTGIDRLMDPPLSTDAVRSYKPDPRAYRLAIDAFGLPKERIAFVAHGGWDAAGAGWFGYRTYWINRSGIASDELGIAPAAVLPSLTPLPGLVKSGGEPSGAAR